MPTFKTTNLGRLIVMELESLLRMRCVEIGNNKGDCIENLVMEYDTSVQNPNQKKFNGEDRPQPAYCAITAMTVADRAFKKYYELFGGILGWFKLKSGNVNPYRDGTQNLAATTSVLQRGRAMGLRIDRIAAPGAIVMMRGTSASGFHIGTCYYVDEAKGKVVTVEGNTCGGYFPKEDDPECLEKVNKCGIMLMARDPRKLVYVIHTEEFFGTTLDQEYTVNNTALAGLGGGDFCVVDMETDDEVPSLIPDDDPLVHQAGVVGATKSQPNYLQIAGIGLAAAGLLYLAVKLDK